MLSAVAVSRNSFGSAFIGKTPLISRVCCFFVLFALAPLPLTAPKPPASVPFRVGRIRKIHQRDGRLLFCSVVCRVASVCGETVRKTSGMVVMTPVVLSREMEHTLSEGERQIISPRRFFFKYDVRKIIVCWTFSSSILNLMGPLRAST